MERKINKIGLFPNNNEKSLSILKKVKEEIKPEEIDDFFNKLNHNEFKVDEVGIQETKVISQTGENKLYSLNEIVVRDKDLNTVKLKIRIDDTLLEKYVGDGILVSTSVGSTAYNTSFKGAIVYNTLHTLQITPIAPINTKAYRNLLAPLILPEEKHIDIFPIKKDLVIILDGENHYFDNVQKIECFVKNKKLKFLRMSEYNFIDIINEKFLND